MAKNIRRDVCAVSIKAVPDFVSVSVFRPDDTEHAGATATPQGVVLVADRGIALPSHRCVSMTCSFVPLCRSASRVKNRNRNC